MSVVISPRSVPSCLIKGHIGLILLDCQLKSFSPPHTQWISFFRSCRDHLAALRSRSLRHEVPAYQTRRQHVSEDRLTAEYPIPVQSESQLTSSCEHPYQRSAQSDSWLIHHHHHHHHELFMLKCQELLVMLLVSPCLLWSLCLVMPSATNRTQSLQSSLFPHNSSNFVSGAHRKTSGYAISRCASGRLIMHARGYQSYIHQELLLLYLSYLSHNSRNTLKTGTKWCVWQQVFKNDRIVNTV